MTIEDPFHEARTFALFSNRIGHVEHGGKKYVAFANLILPYNIGMVLVMWVLTKSTIYLPIFLQAFDLNEFKKLNPHWSDVNIDRQPSSLPDYLLHKMKDIMQDWEPHQFDDIVDQLPS